MDIFVNNNQETISQDYLLELYLQDKKLFDRQGIAVAVNSEIIQKENWSDFMLKEGDKILIIQASQGG